MDFKTVHIKITPDLAEEDSERSVKFLRQLIAIVPHIMDRTRVETAYQISIILENSDAERIDKALFGIGGVWVTIDDGNTLPEGDIINPSRSSTPPTGYEGFLDRPDWRGDEHPESKPGKDEGLDDDLEQAA